MKYVWIFHIFYMTIVRCNIICSDKAFLVGFVKTLKFEMHSSEMRISEPQKHECTVAKNHISY